MPSLFSQLISFEHGVFFLSTTRFWRFFPTDRCPWFWKGLHLYYSNPEQVQCFISVGSNDFNWVVHLGKRHEFTNTVEGTEILVAAHHWYECNILYSETSSEQTYTLPLWWKEKGVPRIKWLVMSTTLVALMIAVVFVLGASFVIRPATRTCRNQPVLMSLQTTPASDVTLQSRANFCPVPVWSRTKTHSSEPEVWCWARW